MKDLQREAALYAIVGGAVGLLAASFMPVPIPRELLALGLSGLGFIVGMKYGKGNNQQSI